MSARKKIKLLKHWKSNWGLFVAYKNIKWVFIFKIIPVLVIYTNKWVSKSGKSFGFWIHIIPKDKDKIGILKHELKHCEQFYRTFFTHFIMYKFSKKYRYRAELEAYAEQIKYYKYTSIKQANWIVNSLMYGYNLDMDINTIKSDVFKIIKRLEIKG